MKNKIKVKKEHIKNIVEEFGFVKKQDKYSYGSKEFYKYVFYEDELVVRLCVSKDDIIGNGYELFLDPVILNLFNKNYIYISSE